MTAIAALPFGFHGYPQLPGFDKENRELVYAMCDAGWTGRITSKRHWLGKAPDGKTTITVPSKNGNNRGLKNAHALFMRWMREQLSPELVELWDKAKEEDDPEIKDILAESVVKKHATEVMHARDERVHQQIIEAIESGVITVEPLIRPYLARKHSGKDGGTRYESQTTLERVWPNGDTDYACAFTGCDYGSDRPRSVAMHYGQEHTRKGESEPAGVGPHHLDPTYTEPLTHRDYRPTQRLVDALTEVLNGIDVLITRPEDIAVSILTWMHDRPDLYDGATKEGDSDGLRRFWLRADGEGIFTVQQALQHALAEGVFDRWLREAGGSAEALLDALRTLAQDGRPADGASVQVRLGEPSVEAAGGIPAGALSAWTPGGALHGWLWPSSVGVGVRPVRPGRSDGSPEQDVLARSGALHPDLSVMPPEDGRRGVELLTVIRALVGQPDQSDEIAALRAENLDLANEVTRLKEERAALRDLLTEGE